MALAWVTLPAAADDSFAVLRNTARHRPTAVAIDAPGLFATATAPDLVVRLTAAPTIDAAPPGEALAALIAEARALPLATGCDQTAVRAERDGDGADDATLACAVTLSDDALVRLAGLARRLAALPPAIWDALARLDLDGCRVRLLGPAADDIQVAADDCLVVDLGGDDVWTLVPIAAGGLRLLIDLGGNDLWTGDGLVVGATQIVVDHGGDDRWRGRHAAAVGGWSAVVDRAGDDHWDGLAFTQAAAAGGVALLEDLAGDDTRRVSRMGQGFAFVGGRALLLDHAGDDRYEAAGTTDPYDRGGAISLAQGASLGLRDEAPGGFGLLIDLAGHDRYQAEMFAQGAAYFGGLGLLIDSGGDDRYLAVRYAQGAGVHEAVGVLFDHGGDDDYRLTYGVGQGMGLDLAIGALRDTGGADRLEAMQLAQGAGTANGIGWLRLAGTARLMLDGPTGWGVTVPGRRLPGRALLDAPAAMFFRAGQPIARPEAPFWDEGRPTLPCPDPPSPLATAIADDPAATLAGLPPGRFAPAFALVEAVRCRRRAGGGDLAGLLDLIARRLASDAPFHPGWFWAGLARHGGGDRGLRHSLALRLLDDPDCLARAIAYDIAEPADMAARAAAAIVAPCWIERAAALALRDRLGLTSTPPDDPPFLATPEARARWRGEVGR